MQRREGRMLRALRGVRVGGWRGSAERCRYEAEARGFKLSEAILCGIEYESCANGQRAYLNA